MCVKAFYILKLKAEKNAAIFPYGQSNTMCKKKNLRPRDEKQLITTSNQSFTFYV